MSQLKGYLLALACTGAATGLRLAMQPQLEDRSRMVLFIPAVLISAWYGGVGPGLFALSLGELFCAWILIPPITRLSFGDRAEQIGMVVYLIVGLGIIALVHREREEKRKREITQLQLEELNLSLEERVRERTQELEFANRELEGFCYTMSHDLRTPARAIVGNIRIVTEDYGDSVPEVLQQRLKRISMAAVKLNNLVDALLTYARLATSDLNREPVDLGFLIASEIFSLSEAGRVLVTVERPEEMMVIGDKAQLRRAVEAIISNAITYSQPGKNVHLVVTFEHTGQDVVVSFKDNGIGFDRSYLHKIFQPFERLHRDEEYPGVGMGLANLARIADRHHGSVWAESTIGEGATFYLRLGHQTPVSARERELINA